MGVGMSRQFPIFLDISKRKIIVYGGGRIASRRVESLLAFMPNLTVWTLEASETIQKAYREGKLSLIQKPYLAGSIPKDSFLVLAATNDALVNKAIYQECQEKQIMVNVCSDRNLCDFQFPGLAIKGDLVIGINAGGQDHHLAKAWTDKIREEVEKDGYDN